VCDADAEESATATVAALNRAAETVRDHINLYDQKIIPVAEDRRQDSPEGLDAWGSCMPGRNQD
jgi:hypothetical protein